MTSGPAEVFDLGYQRLRGRADRTLGAAAARSGATGSASRSGSGAASGRRSRRGSCSGSRSSRWSSSSSSRPSSALGARTRTTSSFRRTATTTTGRWCPLGLFAAVVAPLLICPDRSDRVLSLYAARPITPLDYVGARWAAFVTVVARRPPGLPEAVLFAWNVLDAEQPGSFLGRQLGRRPAVPRRGSNSSRRCSRPSRCFVSSFATRRAYASVAMLAVLFIGSAIGGIAEDNFSGRRSPTRSRSRASRRRSTTPSTGSSATRSTGRVLGRRVARSGSSGLTVVLAALARAADERGWCADERAAEPPRSSSTASRSGSRASSR